MNNANKTEPKSFQPLQLLAHADTLAAASTQLSPWPQLGGVQMGLQSLSIATGHSLAPCCGFLSIEATTGM